MVNVSRKLLECQRNESTHVEPSWKLPKVGLTPVAADVVIRAEHDRLDGEPRGFLVSYQHVVLRDIG